jgi:hypothetical protein
VTFISKIRLSRRIRSGSNSANQSPENIPKVAVHVVFSSLLACPNDGIILQTQPDSSRASLTTRPIQAMTSTGAGRQVRLRYEHRSYSVATLIDGKG